MAWISPQAFFSYSLKILRPKSSGSCTSLKTLASTPTLALLLLSASYFVLLSPSSPRPSLYANPSPASPTASFLASLDHFLSSPRPTASSAVPGDLDAAIRREEESRLYGDPGGAWPAAAAPLRVYVYEMPSKFTYDLLRLFRDSYRETTNLTSNGSPVHRFIEQVGVR